LSKKQESEARKLIIAGISGPRVQERSRSATHHPLGGGAVKVMRRGTYTTSSRPKTCVAESKVTNKTETEWSKSVVVKETMTCIVHIMINPFGTVYP
jgi:hypothetical protein